MTYDVFFDTINTKNKIGVTKMKKTKKLLTLCTILTALILLVACSSTKKETSKSSEKTDPAITKFLKDEDDYIAKINTLTADVKAGTMSKTDADWESIKLSNHVASPLAKRADKLLKTANSSDKKKIRAKSDEQMQADKDLLAVTQ